MKNLKILSILFLLLFVLVQCSSDKKLDTQNVAVHNIFDAVQTKNISAIEKLLNNNNINSFDSSGSTLLSNAIRTEDTLIVKLLLEKGADPNLQNNDDYLSTPLMECSNYNAVDIAKLLIAHGADINKQDKNDDPVINWTAYYGQVEFTKLLLDNHAKTNLKSIHSDGVMQVALKEYQYEVVDLLMQYNISEHKVDSASLPLIHAVSDNSPLYVKEHLNESNVNTRDASGNTLLMIASQKGFPVIVETCLEASADIDAINSVGQTALNLAVYFGHPQVAELLVGKDADVNKTDEHFKITPLEAAARKNRLSLGELLLQHGADINVTDGINNFTPIIWATLYRHSDFVKMLLQYKPDLSIVSKYETTVFDMASNDTLLQLLQEADKK